MPDGLENVNSLVEEAAAKNAASQGAGAADAGAGSSEGSGTGAGAADAGAGSGEGAGTGSADEGSGTGAGAADAGAGSGEGADLKESAKAEIEKAMMEEYGFGSKEELKAFLDQRKTPVKSPEQLKKEESIFKANVTAYAVENELMKPDEVERYEAVKDLDNETLVFQEFAKEVKDEVLEELEEDATEEEILQAVKGKFEKEYPLNSKNDKEKARAEARLKKAADEIRVPLQSSFDNAKTRYEEVTKVRQAYPVYRQSVDKLIADSVPSKFTFFSGKDGEEDIPVVIEIPEATRKEILDSLVDKVAKDEATFNLHKQGKTQDIQTRIKQELDYQLWQKFREEGLNKIAATFTGRGVVKGSDTGATNSFAVKHQTAPASVDKVGAEQQVIDSTRKK